MISKDFYKILGIKKDANKRKDYDTIRSFRQTDQDFHHPPNPDNQF